MSSTVADAHRGDGVLRNRCLARGMPAGIRPHSFEGTLCLYADLNRAGVVVNTDEKW